MFRRGWLVQALRHFVMAFHRLRFRTPAFRLFTGSARFRALGTIRSVWTIRAVWTLWWLVAPVTFLTILTLGRTLRSVGSVGALRTKSGSLKLAQRAEQGFDLTFIRELLAFGQFDQLQYSLHLLQGLTQGFNNQHRLVDRLADGGTVGAGHAWRVDCRVIFRARRLRANWLRTRRLRTDRGFREDNRWFGGRAGRFHWKIGFHRRIPFCRNSGFGGSGRFCVGDGFGRIRFFGWARAATPASATAMAATTTQRQSFYGCRAV
jgi:hypothetical protein